MFPNDGCGLVPEIFALDVLSKWHVLVDGDRGDKVNYVVAGSGKPLILIHGFGNYPHCVL